MRALLVAAIVVVDAAGCVGSSSSTTTMVRVPHEGHVVPRVTGATLAQATTAIAAAGLPWGVRASALPPTSTADLYAVYCITSQKPAGGATMTFRASDDTIRGVELEARPC